MGGAHALGSCRPRRRRFGCRHGHRPLRLYPDPAADDHAGRPHPASRGNAGHRELCRIPRRRVGGHRLTAAGPIDGRVACIARRAGGHPRGNATAVQHHWMAAAADGRGVHQRAGVRHRRQLDAGSSATTPAGVGLRWRRPRHCALGRIGADDAGRSGWQGAWWTASAMAAVLGVGAWAMRGTSRSGAVPAVAPPASPRRANRWFAVLFVSYTLEGIGYIIAGTFLVAVQAFGKARDACSDSRAPLPC